MEAERKQFWKQRCSRPGIRKFRGRTLSSYGHYLWQLGRGDLGQSFKFQAPVRRIIFEGYPATLQLAFLALVVCAAIAIPARMLAAYRRGQPPDRAVGGCARSE